MGDIRSMVKLIGGEPFAVISSKDQEQVYVDPAAVIAVIGPSELYAHQGERHRTCNVYLIGGLQFTTYLSVEEISRSLEEAKHYSVPTDKEPM